MTATLQTVLCLWLAPILLGFLQLCQAISTCEQQALEHVQAHPDAGRVLRRGIDIPELPDLETKYGEGRWTKCVYKHKDSCAQVCASVQYFWEKKSSKVADATFLSDFPAPTPCSQGAPSSGPKKPSSKGTGTDGGPKKPWRKDLRGGPKESDDYYKALGLQKGATDKEIKKAFKKQVPYGPLDPPPLHPLLQSQLRGGGVSFGHLCIFSLTYLQCPSFPLLFEVVCL